MLTVYRRHTPDCEFFGTFGVREHVGVERDFHASILVQLVACPAADVGGLFRSES